MGGKRHTKRSLHDFIPTYTTFSKRSKFIATGCIGRRLLTLVIPTPFGPFEDEQWAVDTISTRNFVHLESIDVLTIPPESLVKYVHTNGQFYRFWETSGRWLCLEFPERGCWRKKGEMARIEGSIYRDGRRHILIAFL